MTSNATLAIQSLATLLSPLAEGPVRIGRAALETTSAKLPAITIWSKSDTPTGNNDPVEFPVEFTRSLVIECKALAEDDYHETLDGMLSDVRKAIQFTPSNPDILGGYAIRLKINESQFFAPTAEVDSAVVQIPIEFDYVEI